MRFGSASALALFLGLGLAGCGGSTHSSPATGSPAATASTRAVTVTTTRTAVAAAKPPGVPYCTAKALGIHFVFSQGAGGSLYSRFAFVNVTAAGCRLFGYPGVSAFTAVGTPIAFQLERDHVGAVRPVVIAPRHGAAFTLQVGDGAVGPCHTTRFLRFIPPNNYAYEQIAHRQVMCGKVALVTPVGTRYP